MVGIVLTLLLAQPAGPDKTVVLVTRRSGAPPALAARVARDLRTALIAKGVVELFPSDELPKRLLALGVKDAATCDGKKACVLELGRQLGADTVVALSVGQVAKDLSIHAEALRVRDGSRTAEQTVVVLGKDASAAASLLAPFVEALSLGPPPPAPLAESPKPEPPAPVPVVTAPEVKPPTTEEPPPQPRRSLLPSILVAAAAVAAGGVTSYFAFSGFGDKERLDHRDTLSDGTVVAIVMRSQADPLADSANFKLTVALACGIGTAVLAVLAGALLVLWGND